MSQAPPSKVDFVPDFATPARRPLWPLFTAGILLLLAAVLASVQSPYRDAYGYGNRGWLDWLISPLEWNPELRLPRVEGALNDIAFSADGQTGFLVGDGGVVLRTDNAGLDWRSVESTGSARLVDVDVSADGDRAVAIDDQGSPRIIAGANRNDWTRPDGRYGWIDISADGAMVWLVAKSGEVARSTDGGANWTRRKLPNGALPDAVAFDDRGGIGWAGGDDGVLREFTFESTVASEAGAIEALDAAADALETEENAGPAPKAAFNLPERSFGPIARDAAAPRVLLLGAAVSEPGPAKEPALDVRQYDDPKNAVQFPIPTTTADPNNAPAARTTPSGTVARPAGSGALRPIRAPASSSRTAPTRVPQPRPTPSSADTTKERVTAPIEAPVIDVPEKVTRAAPIVALAALPDTGGVAGIRSVTRGSELFTNRERFLADVSLTDLSMARATSGWAVGDSAIWVIGEGGLQRQSEVGNIALTSVAATRDGKRAWVAGSNGVLMATVDEAPWFLQLRRPGPAPSGSYMRFPAPWFYFSLLALGGFLAYRRRPLPVEPQPGVAAMGTSDAPAASLLDDKLQFAPLARGISRYLRNVNTQPPLTLAISGDWGSGKSSLLRMVCEDLRRHGNNPVWFNAWHHQDEEQLLAALLSAIRDTALPRWLSLDGLRFRGHLFLLRARRKLPATLLLVALASFFLAFLVVSEPHDWTRRANWLGRLIPGEGSVEGAQLGGKAIQMIAGFAALFTAIGGISKRLKAFGADPAVLLTSTIDNFKLRDASAQVHFRTRFQRQFDEVTEALPYPLVIVVDDLDRCRPETVLQVMEAVNYLMSSGKCFVLFAMATHRVQAALALSFKDIAQELVEIDVITPNAVEPDERDRAERAKRLKYAGEYLQKLVNLEIRVPKREDIAPHLLLTRDSEADDESEVAVARRWARLLWPLAAVAMVAGAAWWAGTGMVGSDGVRTQVVQPKSGVAPRPVTSETRGPRRDAAEPTPTPASSPPVAVEVSEGEGGGAGLYWPTIVLLGAVLALVAMLQYRRRKTDELVADTAPFIRALEVWTPVVARRTPSPRAIKRFGNRLRYFAMLQQAEKVASTDRWDMPEWLARPFAANGAEPPTAPRPKVDVVADHRIVALGAIHEVVGDDWRSWVTGDPAKVRTVLPDVQQAIDAYAKVGWRWPPLQAELDAFERSLKGIRLEGEIDELNAAGLYYPARPSNSPPTSNPKGASVQAKARSRVGKPIPDPREQG